jgi:hypothetical protein
MFLVEIITFMIAWPILWWLGGRLARDQQGPARRPDAGGPGDAKVVDLAAFRRKRDAERRRAAGG